MPTRSTRRSLPQTAPSRVVATNAQSSILSMIETAKHALAVENEEMNDPAVISALAAAAHRGAQVTIAMTADQWDSTGSSTTRPGPRAHPLLRQQPRHPLHPRKGDRRRRRPVHQEVLVRSQNFSVASLNEQPSAGHPHAATRTSSPSSPPFLPPTTRARSTASAPGDSRTVCRPGHLYRHRERLVRREARKRHYVAFEPHPYQKATTEADGYSGDYETNGSGYALIYLNGQLPSAKVTVTVGSATCTTRI